MDAITETVEDRIRTGVETRREENFAAIQETNFGKLADPPTNLPNERRARILNEATDLMEEAYNKLRAAVDTLSICDITATDKYAMLVRDMGKAVRDFSGKL